MVSPSLRYLMAVQNHLLSNTILIRPDDSDDSDSSLQGDTIKVQVNTPFKYPYLCARVNERPAHQTEQWEINVLLLHCIVIYAHCTHNNIS